MSLVRTSGSKLTRTDARAKMCISKMHQHEHTLIAASARIGSWGGLGVRIDAVSTVVKRIFNGNSRRKSLSKDKKCHDVAAHSSVCHLLKRYARTRSCSNACSDLHSVLMAARTRTVCVRPSRWRSRRGRGASVRRAPDESASRKADGAGKASPSHPLAVSVRL